MGVLVAVAPAFLGGELWQWPYLAAGLPLVVLGMGLALAGLVRLVREREAQGPS